MKNLFILLLLCPLIAWGQNLVQAEYFFDEDPGYGKGIKMNFAPQGDIALGANLYIELISPGYHTLYYRFKDDANGWGHTYTANVFVGQKEAAIKQAEYFFDTDPGYGKGISMRFETQESIILGANLYLGLLSPGFHILYYRLKNDRDEWGHTYTANVFIGSEEGNIQKAEYFFDEDPGYGKGITMEFEDTSAVVLSANLFFENVVPGLHTFYYRMKSEEGWGITLSHNIYKPAIPKICKIIYRFDDVAEEHIINLGSTVHDLSHEQSIDISALEHGEHAIHMYVESTSGYRSAVWTSTFSVEGGSNVETTADEKPHFYPNPASDMIFFSGTRAAEHISIISTDGRLIKTYDRASEISISDIANGLYVLSYQLDGKIKVSTLVIAH